MLLTGDPEASSFLFFSTGSKLDGSTAVLALTPVLFVFRVPAWKQRTRRRRGSRCAAMLAGGGRADHAHRGCDVTRQLVLTANFTRTP